LSFDLFKLFESELELVLGNLFFAVFKKLFFEFPGFEAILEPFFLVGGFFLLRLFEFGLNFVFKFASGLELSLLNKLNAVFPLSLFLNFMLSFSNLE
jgi:hypothetical protein